MFFLKKKKEEEKPKNVFQRIYTKETFWPEIYYELLNQLENALVCWSNNPEYFKEKISNIIKNGYERTDIYDKL